MESKAVTVTVTETETENQEAKTLALVTTQAQAQAEEKKMTMKTSIDVVKPSSVKNNNRTAIIGNLPFDLKTNKLMNLNAMKYFFLNDILFVELMKILNNENKGNNMMNVNKNDNDSNNNDGFTIDNSIEKCIFGIHGNIIYIVFKNVELLNTFIENLDLSSDSDSALFERKGRKQTTTRTTRRKIFVQNDDVSQSPNSVTSKIMDNDISRRRREYKTNYLSIKYQGGEHVLNVTTTVVSATDDTTN